MKKLFNFSLVMLAMFLANVAKADDIEFLVKVAKENSKWVSFITNDAQEFELTLSTSDGEIVYEQKVKTVGNKFQTYDLNALPQGSYQLKMESATRLVSYQIDINNDVALISQPTIVAIKRPILVKEERLITLDLNGTCNGEVNIVIYNEFNEKIHDDVYNDSSKVITRFDVSKTMSKELTFVISSRGQEFSETIKL